MKDLKLSSDITFLIKVMLFGLILFLQVFVVRAQSGNCILSSSDNSNAKLITCLNAANASCGGTCDTIFTTIPDDVGIVMTNAWQVATYPTIVFEMEGLGSSLEFTGSGGGSTYLRLPATSVFIVDSRNTDALTASNQGNVRIAFGSGNLNSIPSYKGNQFSSIISTGGVSAVGFGNPLPIELYYFRGVFVGTSVLIEWATLMEFNNDYFEIEKSDDGITFYSIGEVKGVGNSNELVEYSFLDPSLTSSKIVYYRLKQVDIDGQSEVFDIIALKGDSGKKGNVTVYPNPTQTYVKVFSSELVEREFSYSIVNLYGSVVREGIAEWSKPLSLIGLESGVYRMIINNSSSTKLIIK